MRRRRPDSVAIDYRERLSARIAPVFDS